MNVMWDMGGTLIDTYSPVNTMLAGKVADAGGQITPERVATLTRRSISSAIQTLAQRFDLSEGELHASYDALKASWEREPAPLIAGAREALEAIVAGGGANMIVTHRDRPSATTLLEQHELAHLISDMVCAPDGFPRKPDPAMFREMLSRTGLAPEKAIAVGDREIDITAARSAGLRAALLAPAGRRVRTDADWTIRSLAEVPMLS
ncbi:HAD superfamily hydrolase (TIGR01549 family) [Arcanobacterium wilhelmae]|uniref:HAD superfamily hydrolase (TIGR01549 family) n=1 Tax=Arcanobacterium wilhelmae TaxID=1803177 RepID=A0ABT9NAD8_9ACTO|nr:HAD-IA family hydrolase [Arcanobacterium wilhelmae]MDP9800665.1 HAD superfamily hydrolase (TIGR01549 family) [Arcanobacterium wilhelmae]WFN90068.1 HAD-IA family hydrolase [Arcanobacterium wilhelmae]